MKLKITAKGNVNDTKTGENFTFGDTLEREPKRAEDFINAGVAEEIKEEKEIEVEPEEVEAPSKPEKKTRKKKSKKA